MRFSKLVDSLDSAHQLFSPSDCDFDNYLGIAQRRCREILVPLAFQDLASGLDLTAVFRRYVYGQSALADGVLTRLPKTFDDEAMTMHHPRRYTRAELAHYR